MTLKKLQWVLFLLIAIGTPVTVFSLGVTNGLVSAMIIFSGLSASLFVFCFVPYIPKYYLSELLIIICAIALLMTLLVNILNMLPHKTEWIGRIWVFGYIVFAQLLPFLTLAYLEWRRPVHERLGYSLPKPVERSPEERMKYARNLMIYNGVWLILLLFMQIMINGAIFSANTFFAVYALMNLFTMWRDYRKAKRELNKAS